jgi:hypothetical protein
LQEDAKNGKKFSDKKETPHQRRGVSFRGAQKKVKNFLRGIPIKGFPLEREQEMAFSP